MPRLRSRRCRFCLLLLVLLVSVVLAGPSRSAARIDNPAEPARGGQTVALEELWRLDGADEDLLLGVIGSVTADPSGTVYLLDSQLSEVQVVSPSGEYLATIGREGEGPGEFRRPNGILCLPGPTIGVVQSRPGKIVLLTPAGEPAGELPIPGSEGGTAFLGGAHGAGGNVYLQVNFGQRTDTGFEMHQEIVKTDISGSPGPTLYQSDFSRDFSNPVVDERTSFGVREWAAAPDGRVFVVTSFDAYDIAVYSPDGVLERTIARAYAPRRRSAEEKAQAGAGRAFRGGRRFQMEFKASETDPAILDLFPREDGTLWVLTGRGAFETTPGVLASFDVFDAEGRFVRQVTLEGDGSYRDDRFFFVGSDRLIIVEELVEARRAAFGGSDEDEETEEIEVEPLSVVGYRIPSLRTDGSVGAP